MLELGTGALALLDGPWLPYITPGVVNGAVWALLGVGLVLTYQTTGVLNLAFGAQAFAAAIIYYDLLDRGGWPSIPAMFVSAFVASPILGYGLDRLVYRHMRTQPIIIRLAVTIGMLTAIPAIMLILLGNEEERLAPPSLLFDPVRRYRWGSLAINSDQLTVLVVAALVLIGLAAFMRYSDTGLRMRAVVESPRLAEVHGVGAVGVSTGAWLISSILAGLAGVLLVPTFQSVTPVPFTLLVMAALAAAVFGRLTSLPLTVLGAIVAGVGSDLVIKFFAGAELWKRELSAGLKPSFPFIFMFIVLLVNRSLGSSTKVSDPMAGVDPPPVIAGARSTVARSLQQRALRWGAVAVGFLLCLWQFGPNTMSSAAFMTVIFLSFMLLTGQGGHVSMGHAAFVGIGAMISAQLVDKADWPLLPAIIIGAIAAGVAGLLLAIPTLRLGELPMALGTFGFGILATYLVFNREYAFGNSNIFLSRPKIFGLDLNDDNNFLIVALVVLGLTILLLRHLLRGTTGRYAVALRGSPTAAASIGINGVPLRVSIFALSAGLAGLGGGFLGFLNRGIAPTDYTVNTSLYWLVVAMVVGVYTMRSAVAAGLILVLLPRLIDQLPESLALFEFVLFGLGVVSLARHPEGAFEYFANLPARMRERTRMLSGSTTAADHEAALERLMAEPELVPDEPGAPVEVLQTTVEERLERRRRRRELGIELSRLRARIPAYPITFLYILTFAFAVDAMSRSLLSIVYDDVRRDFGVSDFKMSALNAGFAIVAGISFIPFGMLADRWDRKKIVALGFVPWALAMAWQSWAGTFMMMFIARLFLGSIEGTHGPTVPSMLGDYYPVKRRNRAFGIFATGSSLGNVIGFMIGGALAESLGWRGAFFVFGVIGAIAGVIVWFALDEPERGLQDAAARLEAEIDTIDRIEELEAQALAYPEIADEILARDPTAQGPVVDEALAAKAPYTFDYRDISAWQGLKLVFKNRTFSLLLAGQVATDFFIGILALYAVTFFRRYHGLSLSGASGVVSLLTFALIIGTIQAGRIGDRLVSRGTPAARVKLTWLCRLAVFAAVVMAWAPQNLALAIPGFLLSGYFLGLTTPLTTAMSVDLMVARLRGVSSGFIAGLRAGSMALGPLLVGWIADELGLRQGILLLSPVLLLSAVVTWLATRFYDTDAGETQAEAVRQHLLEDADPRVDPGNPLEPELLHA